MLQEPVPVEDLAIQDDRADFLEIADILGGIRVEHQEVRVVTGLHLAHVIPAEQLAEVAGGRGQRLARRQPDARQQLELGME